MSHGILRLSPDDKALDDLFHNLSALIASSIGNNRKAFT
jgi:hypothetical protein